MDYPVLEEPQDYFKGVGQSLLQGCIHFINARLQSAQVHLQILWHTDLSAFTGPDVGDR